MPKLFHTFRNVKYVIRYIYINDKLLLFYYILRTFIISVYTLIIIYLPVYIIGLVEKHISLKLFIFNILIIIIILLSIDLFNSLTLNTYLAKAENTLKQGLQKGLLDKASKIDIKNYDKVDFYNNFILINSEIDSVFIQIMHKVERIIVTLISIVFSASIYLLLSMNILLIIFIIMGLICNYYISLKAQETIFQKEVDLKYSQRKKNYIHRVFYLQEYAKEIKLGNIFFKLIENFKSANKEIKNIQIGYGKKLMLLNFLNSFVFNTLIYNGIFIILLSYKLIVEESITITIFFTLYRTFYTIYSSGGNFIDIFPEFSKFSLYIDKYINFMNTSSNIASPMNPIKIPENIEDFTFKNVSFSYEGNKDMLLNNITLSIRPYEKVAIVGQNGAGKSTLIKLILRLYDPTYGEILLNNINIKNYNVNNYRNNFAVIFQDYKIYAATIGENVVMDIFSKESQNQVTKALNTCGIMEKIETLPNGINSSLLNEFDKNGINLSGGELQKIAMSRVFFKNCNIVILDEPNSSLDAIAEYKMNKEIMDLAKEKSIIFITHRLTTTKMADTIYMLKDGKIVEKGSHDSLIKLNGEYATMFKIQAEKYKIGGEV